MNADDDGFLSRWSRRKAGHRERPPVTPVAPAPATPPPATTAAGRAADPPAEPPPDARPHEGPSAAPAPAPSPALPPPSLDDVGRLTPQSDFTRFVGADVDAGVRNAALKKLFADPHFNVMDGLDVYIEDYGKPDPLPAAWLRRLANPGMLGLPDVEDAPPDHPPDAASAAPAPTVSSPMAAGANAPLPDEDPDLRLQPHDAAGRPGADAGAGQDPAGRH